MATKTISIEVDVYEQLKRLKKGSRESFSQVLRRELPKEKGMTAQEFLAFFERRRALGLNLSDAELDEIDEIIAEDPPPDDPWE